MKEITIKYTPDIRDVALFVSRMRKAGYEVIEDYEEYVPRPVRIIKLKLGN